MSRGSEGKAGEAGFGMVSVLVAMVLLAVAVVSLSSSSAFLVSLQTDAAGRTTATAVGVAYMEEVRRRPVGTLSSEGPTRVNGLGLPDQDGSYVRTLTIEAQAGDILKANVEVRYPGGLGRSGAVRLDTFISRREE